MKPKSGDQFSIHVGGDASGPVVAGNNNIVEVGVEKTSQTNMAKERGTVFAVTNGDMHVHHTESDADDVMGTEK